MQRGYLGHKNVPDTPKSLFPWLVNVSDAVSVAAGRSSGAAVTLDGAVFTWGSHPLGRTGGGSTPARVQGLDNMHVTKVCIGEYHAVAITRQGHLVTWGATGEGQHKEVNGIPLSNTATLLEGMPPNVQATALACGYQHTLVLGLNCSSQFSARRLDIGQSILVSESEPSHEYANLLTTEITDLKAGVVPESSASVAASPGQLLPQPQAHVRVGGGAQTLSIYKTAEEAATHDTALFFFNQTFDGQGKSQTDTTTDHVHNPNVDQSVGNDSIDAIHSWSKLQEEPKCDIRPPWLSEQIQPVEVSKIHPLDRAWFGCYVPPTIEMVRSCSCVCKLSISMTHVIGTETLHANIKHDQSRTLPCQGLFYNFNHHTKNSHAPAGVCSYNQYQKRKFHFSVVDRMYTCKMCTDKD